MRTLPGLTWSSRRSRAGRRGFARHLEQRRANLFQSGQGRSHYDLGVGWSIRAGVAAGAAAGRRFDRHPLDGLDHHRGGPCGGPPGRRRPPRRVGGGVDLQSSAGGGSGALPWTFFGAITVEAHVVAGGLGAQVAEVIAERSLSCPLRIHAVRRSPDGRSGSQAALWRKHGLDHESLVRSRGRCFPLPPRPRPPRPRDDDLAMTTGPLISGGLARLQPGGSHRGRPSTGTGWRCRKPTRRSTPCRSSSSESAGTIRSRSARPPRGCKYVLHSYPL